MWSLSWFLSDPIMNETILHLVPYIDESSERKCSFSPPGVSLVPAEDINCIDFSGALDDTAIHLRHEVPQQMVVNMFQKLVSNIYFN